MKLALALVQGLRLAQAQAWVLVLGVVLEAHSAKGMDLMGLSAPLDVVLRKEWLMQRALLAPWEPVIAQVMAVQ